MFKSSLFIFLGGSLNRKLSTYHHLVAAHTAVFNNGGNSFCQHWMCVHQVVEIDFGDASLRLIVGPIIVIIVKYWMSQKHRKIIDPDGLRK